MKRQFLFGTMLSVALAVGVSAQAPQSGAGQSQPPSQPPAGQSQPPSDRPSGQAMALTGCVQAAGSGSTAAPGAAAGASSGGFVLTNITPSSTAGSATPGAPGSPAGSPAGTTGSARPSSYRLSGGDNLQQYVGQRVEITGSASARPSGAGSPSAGASTPGSPGSPGASASGSPSDMPTLRVTSVKPASGGGSCPK
jgi:hypothetical protein